jgi:hypothetical protein
VPKRKSVTKKDVSSADPESIYLVTVLPTKVEDFVTSVARQNIIIVIVKSNLISWLIVSTAVKRATLPESVQPTKKVCIEKEAHALGVDRLGTL